MATGVDTTNCGRSLTAWKMLRSHAGTEPLRTMIIPMAKHHQTGDERRRSE